MRNLLAICLGLGLAVLLGAGSGVHAYEWYGYNGHYYTLTNSWSNWTQAETEAVGFGGHLVTINDAAENTWLTNTFKDTYDRQHFGYIWNNIAWIGYYKGSTDWQWISGEPVTYYNHDYPAWPDADGGTHAYLHLAYHPFAGTWNSNDLHNVNYAFNPKGIIEIDSWPPLVPPPVVPLPSSLLLFGSTLLGMVGIGGYRPWRKKQ